MELSPNSTDLRTNQALESPGWESVPSGYLHPGRSAVGIGMSWVNGCKMNGLGGKASITAQLVKASISIEGTMLSPMQVPPPYAFFPIKLAAPAMPP